MVRTVKSFTKIQTARIAALLVLAALLGAGVQAVVAKENTMTIAIGNFAGIGTDPTLYLTEEGGWPIQDHHHYTHWEPLITIDNRSNIMPWLAKSYEVSDDYKTITFHLRNGIAFADGKPLNASVVKFNFDRLLTYGWAEHYGKNGSKDSVFVNYDHSEAVDDNTFNMYFTKGWIDMPRAIASNSIVYGYFIHPADVDPAWDIRGTLKPEKRFNGLGPYEVDENESVSDQKIVLNKRHSWRDDYNFHKPKLDKIVLKVIKDPQVAVMALEKGDIDYYCRYWNVPLDSLPALDKNPAISIKTAPETRMYYIQTAWWKEPFLGEDGILLRKAICYALNRTEMVEGAFNGYALPATDAMFLSPLKSDSPDCCHKGYDYDLEKAKKLLAEAGWNDTNGDGILDKNGKSLKDLDLVISPAGGLSWQKDLALVVQSQLKKIGIDVQIQTVEYANYWEVLDTKDFDLRMEYNMGGYNSAVQEFSRNFDRKGSDPSYVNDYSNQNKTLATAVESAQTADSREEQEKSLCQACNILYEEAGTIPLVYQIQYAVMNNKVNGFQFGASKNTYEQDHIEVCWVE